MFYTLYNQLLDTYIIEIKINLITLMITFKSLCVIRFFKFPFHHLENFIKYIYF